MVSRRVVLEEERERKKKKLIADPSRLVEAYLSTTMPVGHNAYVI